MIESCPEVPVLRFAGRSLCVLCSLVRDSSKIFEFLKRERYVTMENNKMKKDLGVMSAMALVVGCVIGAGVFFKPYAIYQATGGAPGMGILAWIIGGLVSLFAALTFSESSRSCFARATLRSAISS